MHETDICRDQDLFGLAILRNLATQFFRRKVGQGRPFGTSQDRFLFIFRLLFEGLQGGPLLNGPGQQDFLFLRDPFGRVLHVVALLR